MKFSEKSAQHLKKEFKECYVYDQRGDGHFLQMIVIDQKFEGKMLVARSKMIFAALGELKDDVHAYSVKGFTAEEWEKKKDDFELIAYEHYR